MKNRLIFAVLSLLCTTSASFAESQPTLTTETKVVADESVKANTTRAMYAELVKQADADTKVTSQDATLMFNGILQFRYEYGNTKNGSNSEYGFETNGRLDLTGKLGDLFTYRVSPKFDTSGNFTVQDVWVATEMMGVGLKFGQFRPQFMYELNGNDEDNIAVMRSVVANTLGQTFTQGVQGSWKMGFADFYASFNDGLDHANTPVNLADNHWGATSRVVLHLISEQNTNLDVGGGINHENTFDVYTADVTWKLNDLIINGEYAYGDYSDYTTQGIVGTVAYNVTDKLQPYARYEYGKSDGSADLNIAHLGANYFLAGQAVKLSVDGGYSLGELGSAWKYTDTGWNPTSEKGSYLLMAQLQIKF